MLIFIYLRDKENIDLYIKNNEPFVLAGQENHLLYLKWLYSLDKKIDIFSDEIILEQFIFKKNYSILEWYAEILYNNNINKDQIYNQLNYIFTNLCKNDEIELLIKIKDNLNIDLNEYDLNNFLLN